MKKGTKVVEINVQIAPVTVHAEGTDGAFTHVFPLHGRTRWNKDEDYELQSPEEVLTQVVTGKSNGMVRFPAQTGCIYLDRRRIIRMEIGKAEPHWVRRTVDINCEFLDEDGDELPAGWVKVISETVAVPKPGFWSKLAFWRKDV